ncbi:MAG: putative AlkP superfamily pyrophosphatase or phosphodiesterase [Candidatus Poriferisodalaceae bacterium]
MSSAEPSSQNPSTPQPRLPRHGKDCVTGIVPAVVAGVPFESMPESAAKARRTVLLVVDGLGWLQLQQNRDRAPNLMAASGGAITTIAPSTTASALTSIATGTPPGEHGVVGYRIPTHEGVLNCLRWSASSGDARRSVIPEDFQPLPPFLGSEPPVVTRSEFRTSGFTGAHLRDSPWFGWYTSYSIVPQVAAALATGERFVYAYYDGLDKIAHAHGVDSDHYRAELEGIDRLIGDLRAELDDDTALLVTADHGLVDVGDRVVQLDQSVASLATGFSGEARFLWLHGRQDRHGDMAAAASDAHGDDCWVVSVQQMLDEKWFGSVVSRDARERLGDVAIIAHQPIAILEPGSPDTSWLRGRHGSLTDEEMLVPLLAVEPD